MVKQLYLKKNEDHRILSGHLWVFSNEILRMEGNPKTGEVVSLYNHGGLFLGVGFYNSQSLIALRLLSTKEEEINADFFQRKITSALALRKKIYPDESTYRLVNGEADYLPGLVIDKYNDYISIQTFSAGMDQRLDMICDVLESILQPKGIVERNEAHVRTYEGLALRSGVIRGAVEPTVISEGGIQYSIDLLEGQKTAFFLDQRENRKSFQKYVKNSRVLDLFCNDGGFSIHAVKGGAKEVIGVDASTPAIDNARKNAELNNCTSIQYVVSDAFEYLTSMKAKGEKFDVINLDPPSFAKSKKDVTKAKQSYKKMHRSAIQLLSPGGILATASCSHHIFDEIFIDSVCSQAMEESRNITLLEWHGASPDHPVLPAMPETKYLKFGVFHLE